MSGKVKSKDQVVGEVHQLPEKSGSTRLHHQLAKNREEDLLQKDCRERLAWIENSPICTKILDLDFNLQYMSQSGVKDLRIDDISQYYGQPYPFAFYPDSFRSPMVDNLKKVRETGEQTTQEAYVTDIEGNKLWYHSTITPVKNDENQLDHIMVVSVNFTAQKEAEDSLRRTLDGLEAEIEKRNSDLYRSEERFSQAMRGTNDGLWDWNLETDAVYYSPRWKSMLGYEEDELEGTLDTWKSLVHPDDKDWVLERIEDYLEGREESFEVEMRMRHKNGQEVVVLSRGFLVQDKSGDKTSRMVGTHVDLTERTKSEQFILSTSEILKMIATREPASDIYDAIALLYESRHPGMRCSMLILVGNKLMHGGAPSLPKEYCEAVNGLENGPCVGSCGTATYHGKSVYVENIETDPKWAKIKDVALPHGMRCCWSEPIKNSIGEVLGAFGMYYDYPALPNESEANDLASAARLAGIIMEREKSEKELNQYKNHLEDLVAKRTLELEETKKEAEEANRAKSKFLSSMSHELRTPLNAIIGFGQVMESDPIDSLSEGQRESVEHILKSGEHLLDLINEILDLSQIEAGKLSLTIEPIRLDLVIKEAIELVQTMANEYDVSVVSEVDSDEEIHVVADQLRLKQVLLNLLSNGIKYNKPGGKVGIEVVSSKKEHQIVVRDTGIGIEKKDLQSLFEPFNRLGAKAMDIEGTGIGLTITKRLVEVLNGSLDIESEPGKGSAFTVTMPAGEVESEDESNGGDGSEDQLVEKATEGEETTILYVEDNFVNIKLVERILHRCPNIRLLIAKTGKEGVELAEREQPALVLMDMNLPDISGLEALKQMQKNEATASIPVVGVSADAMLDVVKKSEIEGFKDYITKPFRIDHFLEVINSFVG